MAQPSPESYNDYYTGYEMDHVAGYQYEDPYIWGFTQTHLNGAGCPSLSDILLMPTRKDSALNYNRHEFKSTYDKHTETATPGYYAVNLTGVNVKTELTATEHVAYHRYTYDTSSANLLVDLQYGVRWNINAISDNIIEARQQFEDDYTLSGYRYAREWVGRKLYYVVKFNKPIKKHIELPAPEGKKEKAPRFILQFDLASDNRLEVQIAMSLTGIEAAKDNLNAEIPGGETFDNIKANAKEKWNKILSAISIEGTDAQRTAFYTSLYHLYIQPNNLADVNGTYRAPNDSILKSGNGKYYSTLSFWDTHRAANPLYTILTPRLVGEMATTMLDYYRHKPVDTNNPMEANKYLPRLGLWGKETNTMIGNHAIPVIVDAWLKGIKPEGYNDEQCYEALWNTATKPHFRNHVELIDEYGYIPYDRKRSAIDDGRETVSRLLETAYDDYCLSLMAEKLGKKEDFLFLSNRAGYYKNVFDKESGFMRGRKADGTFKKGIDVTEIVGEWLEGSDFTEGNAWHYLFHVQHDVKGLKALMGDDLFLNRLDTMFFTSSKPEVRTLVWNIYGTLGQYWHGNEPCHHVSYLYKYTGSPHKTDALLRFLCTEFHKNAPTGLKGNDDCGQMSAWYLFASMGFYPINPCGGEYVIGAPQIPSAIINLPNGKQFKMTAENLSDENYVVAEVRLNDKPLDRLYITHDEMMKGGTLRFVMKPDKAQILETLKLKFNKN
jgi:predicted alpha-1,2-mannosidase